MKEFPEVMTVRQVAEYLQVSTRTVYCLLANGQLRGARVGQRDKPGKAWRVRKSEADRFLAGGEWHHAQAAGPDELTEEQRKRIAAYEDGLPDEIREEMHRNNPIVAWRCKACWTVTYIDEFTTGGKNPPAFCSGCGMKAAPGNLARPDNFIFEGRYEAGQPWAEAAPGRGRR